MKIKNLVLTTTVLLFLLSCCFTAAMAENNKIHWQSYETGMKMVKEQKKKGFMHFYTDWCTYCKLMNKQTFADSNIIKYLNDNFIAIRVNADKKRDVARKYRVTRFPNNWFIAEDGSTLSSQAGFIPPDMLLNMLKFLNTDSFKTMKFSEFMKKQEETQRTTTSQ